MFVVVKTQWDLFENHLLLQSCQLITLFWFHCQEKQVNSLLYNILER